jgi:hypothetical protein
VAWSTPLTATANTPLTAAQWNASVRDNMNLTPAALATTAGSHFVATGTNAIAERLLAAAVIATSETTANTAYVDLATVGPSVTVTTGPLAMVFTTCTMSNSGANDTRTSFDITGATTSAPTDSRGITAGAGNNIRATCAHLMALTPGSNVFKQMYRVSAGTGTFSQRNQTVMAF